MTQGLIPVSSCPYHSLSKRGMILCKDIYAHRLVKARHHKAMLLKSVVKFDNKMGALLFIQCPHNDLSPTSDLRLEAFE